MRTSTEAAPPLPRRPFFGVRTRAVAGGLLTLEVHPRGSAAGLLGPGDRLLAVDGAALVARADLRARLRRARVGERLRLEVERAGAPAGVEVALLPMPFETGYRGHVLYDSIVVDGVRLRTIVGVPAGAGPWPGWLLIPGCRCRSQEQALTPRSAEAGLLAMLAVSGALTMRVERPGVGDSEGGPCGALEPADEVAIYRAGLQALAARGDVRSGRLALFAHDAGAWIAPLVAAAAPVRGIALHGASGRSWGEHLVRGLGDAGRDPARPGAPVAGRSPSYHRALAALDLAAAWAPLVADVLLLHGLRDAIVDEADVDALAAILAARPRLPGKRRGACEVARLEGLRHRLTLGGLRGLWGALARWADRRQLLGA